MAWFLSLRSALSLTTRLIRRDSSGMATGLTMKSLAPLVMMSS